MSIVERVYTEIMELREKQARLRAFIASEKFRTLPAEHQELLEQQAYVMGLYGGILRERLYLLGEELTRCQ